MTKGSLQLKLVGRFGKLAVLDVCFGHLLTKLWLLYQVICSITIFVNLLIKIMLQIDAPIVAPSLRQNGIAT